MRVKVLLSVALLGLLLAAPAQANVTDYGSAMDVDSVSIYVPVYGGTWTCGDEPFTGQEFTAAAGNLINGGFYPLGTVLRVYNPDTGLSVDVVINDCTPNAYPGGNFDLSWAAAVAIGMTNQSGTISEGRSYDLVIWPVGYDPSLYY